MRFYRYEMKPALRRAGLPVAEEGARGVRFHDLCHSYASISLSDRLDLVRLSERMGHQSIVITQMLYGHLVDEDHEADVARLARPVAPPRREAKPDRPLRAV
jgi:integrase